MSDPEFLRIAGVRINLRERKRRATSARPGATEQIQSYQAPSDQLDTEVIGNGSTSGIPLKPTISNIPNHDKRRDDLVGCLEATRTLRGI